MKNEDPELQSIRDDWERRIEDAYLRIRAGLPPEPWLPHLPTLTGIRRQVRRARAGIVKSGNPRIPTAAWADTIEQGIVMNMLLREEQRKEIEEEKRQGAERLQRILDYNRSWMEVYHALKRLPEANDPTTEVGAQVLSMKRELRKLRGRPKKRGKGGAKGDGGADAK
ncbi:MAG TPA: hypothetical protein VF618_09095 [Thermoanaerobaculia bacterium]